MHLNGRWQPGSFYLTQTNHVTPTGLPERDDDLLQDFQSPVWEIGGDIIAAPGRRRDQVGRAGQPPAARRLARALPLPHAKAATEVLGGFEQLQDAQRNETLLRLTWTRSNLLGFSFETGVEGVLNTLDQNVQLFEFLEGGEPVQIDLPVDSGDGEGKARRAVHQLRPPAFEGDPDRWRPDL